MLKGNVLCNLFSFILVHSAIECISRIKKSAVIEINEKVVKPCGVQKPLVGSVSKCVCVCVCFQSAIVKQVTRRSLIPRRCHLPLTLKKRPL